MQSGLTVVDSQLGLTNGYFAVGSGARLSGEGNVTGTSDATLFFPASAWDLQSLNLELSNLECVVDRLETTFIRTNGTIRPQGEKFSFLHNSDVKTMHIRSPFGEPTCGPSTTMWFFYV